MELDITGKRIIVTGGARGMGAAIVKAYVSEGAHVVSLDVQNDLGEEAVKEANEIGPGKATYYSCDISNPSEVESVFDTAIKEMGGLDVLANIAGVIRTAPAEDIPNEDFDFIMNVNVRGTVLTNQLAFKAMRDNGSGAIINFGSISGLRQEPGGAMYSASKGAVMSWTRTVAAEWGPYGIRVNAVNPIISTPMYEETRNNMTPEQRKANDEKVKQIIPLGGAYGDAERDLAPVMIFLASDASRFITSQLIPVDGGMSSVR